MGCNIIMKEFNQLGQEVFGDGWQSKLARTFKVNRRTVGRWSKGEHPIPESVLMALRVMAKA